MNGLSPRLYLASIFSLYWNAILDGSRALCLNWAIIPASVGLIIASGVVGQLVAPLGYAGGFISGIVTVILIALYYTWLAAIERREKLQWRDLIQIDWGLFFGVLSILFIFFLLQLALETLTHGLDARAFLLVVQLLLFLSFNALPEVVYISRLEGLEGLQRSAIFCRDNWLEWFLLPTLLLLPWILVAPADVLVHLARTNPVAPGLIIGMEVFRFFPPFSTLSYVLASVLGATLVNWYMLIRAPMFRELESGTRRQRMFRARQ